MPAGQRPSVKLTTASRYFTEAAAVTNSYFTRTDARAAYNRGIQEAF
jgi:hypothetical protein